VKTTGNTPLKLNLGNWRR